MTKLCVLIPSEEYRLQAGCRIRYGRLTNYLEAAGVRVDIRCLVEYSHSSTYSHDVYLFSKCYDVSSVVFATALKKSGKVVMIDLFDDYFSQREDARFINLRYWFAEMVSLSDSILCSTPKIVDVVRGYNKEVPTYVINDPGIPIDDVVLYDSIDSKLEKIRAKNELVVGWFGIGDNPHFDVGLRDLYRFLEEITEFDSCKHKVRFEILTNRRALTAENLHLLSKLPFEYSVEIWTEELECKKLNEWPVCIIPVNNQQFSVVKSLNRAITALQAGVQVVSLGFPLYKPASTLIYRDVGQFLKDIDLGVVKHSEISSLAYHDLIERFASPSVEANKLCSLITRLSKEAPKVIDHGEFLDVALVHGFLSNIIAHKMVQRLGGLSVGSPFSKIKAHFDLNFKFDKNGGGLEVYASKKLYNRHTEIKKYAVAELDLNGAKYVRLELNSSKSDVTFEPLPKIDSSSILDYALYSNEVYAYIRHVVKVIFPSFRLVVSEQSKSVWSVDGGFGVRYE